MKRMAMLERPCDSEIAGARASTRAPARRRLLAIGAVLLAALTFAVWPVPTADAAMIICVWDDARQQWYCRTEVGVMPATGAVVARSLDVRDDERSGDGEDEESYYPSGNQ